MSCCHSNEGGLCGIIVVVAAFFIQMLVFGTAQSIGVYNVEFLRYFERSASAVSFVGSINTGLLLGAGPVASLLMSLWGHRRVMLLGAVLSNLGLVCMPFANSLGYMYVAYGVLTGLGYCLTYVPSHVLCGLYYCKHRSIATGIATSGIGLGTTVFPIIFTKIIDTFGWKGSLFIVAGMNLHLVVLAALHKPVPKHTQAIIEEQEKHELAQVDATKDTAKHARDTKSESNTKHNVSVWSVEDIEVKVINGNSALHSVIKPNRDNTANTSKLSFFIEKLVRHFKSVFEVDFLIYCLSNIFWNAGIGIPVIFLPEFCVLNGFTRENASLMITVLGIGCTIGCVLGGLLGNIQSFNRITIYSIGNLGLGVATIAIIWEPIKLKYGGLLALGFIVGASYGVILGLLVVVTSDLLGIEALGNGFGYLMMANGIGIFGGPPIAGLVYDKTGNMDHALLLAGVLSILGGLTMFVVHVRRCCRRLIS